MVASLLLLASLFHHKPKPKPLTPEQQAFIVEVKQDEKYVEVAKEGAKAYEADVQYAQYERPEIDRFEHQLYKCVQDEQYGDLVGLVNDARLLDEYGQALDALDKDLHRENAI